MKKATEFSVAFFIGNYAVMPPLNKPFNGGKRLVSFEHLGTIFFTASREAISFNFLYSRIDGADNEIEVVLYYIVAALLSVDAVNGRIRHEIVFYHICLDVFW